MTDLKLSASIKNFLKKQEIVKFKNLFSPHIQSFRFVGGVVRNLVIGKEITDYDIATTLKSQELINLCKELNVNFKPTGLHHGTITIIIDKIAFEVTTLRVDKSCDGRHAITEYTDSWEEDSNRRDFTMNALYLDFEGRIYDFHNGINDAKNGIIKFIGNPETRIAEDYLRILRLFRFWAFYGKTDLEEHILRICQKLSEFLKIISIERIKSEIDKIISSTKFKETLILLYKHRILRAIPYLKIHNIEQLPEIITEEPIIRRSFVYFCFFSSNPDFFIKFPLSKKERGLIEDFIYYKNKPIEYAIYFNGFEFANLLANYLKIENFLNKFKNINTSLPISNLDIINLGITGKNIGIIKKKAEIKWIESGFAIQKHELLDYCKNINKSG